VLTRDDLLEVLSRIRITAPVRADEVTASTNATAAAMAADGTPEWTLVAASHQTQGRGRQGRTWDDVPGRALLFSLVLRPAIPPNRAGLLSLLAGAQMATAIREVAGVRAVCKWPNDLLLDGRKVGGLLLESSVVDGALRWVVVGIGVNLDAPAGVEGAAGIGDVDPKELLAAFMARFRTAYETAELALPDRTRVAWMPVAETVGRLVRATTTSGDTVAGRATGIDDFGGLRLSTDHGELRVAFGDVHHLDEHE
jgi:BirA family transcriptional regulator, biotin operon repressor / biotin---[acetyl-CoA-carboxylase] ligase